MMNLHMGFLCVAVLVPIGMVATISHTPSTIPITSAVVTVSPSVTPVSVAPVVSSPPVPVSHVSDQETRFLRLRDFVLDVMESWPKGSKELPTADLSDIASDIAAAVNIEPTTIEIVTSKSCSTVHGSDRCFWNEGLSSDGAKSILLAALAYWEGSRFVAYADESLCTDKTWRQSDTGKHFMHIGGDCDGGHAYTLWQIHPIETKDAKGSHIDGVCDHEHVAPGIYDGAYRLNRFGAARCALELARESIAMRSNLTRYTGEIGSFHPKADERLEFAREAIRKHPWSESQ